MEKEWPEMTKEFKRLQREQYELFLQNNMTMVLVIFLLGTMLQTEEEIKLCINWFWFRMNDKLQRLKEYIDE